MSFFKRFKKDTETKEKSDQEKPEKKIKIEEKEKKAKAKKVKAEAKKISQDWLKSEGQLAVDVYYTDSELCIQAPIAGVTSEDLDISVENEMLIIKGERKIPDANKEKNYSYQECYWGPFSRQIILPEDADLSKIKASLEKGILTVKIPKISRTKKKKVTIVSGD